MKYIFLEMGMKKGQCFLVAVSLLNILIMACLAMALTNIITDQSALLAFKSQLSLDPSHVLSRNWSHSSPTCEWIGVTCSSRHPRVTALDISEMGLHGNLPSQLGNLSFLVSLNLRNNSFRGQLPQELAKLHRLRFLDFGFNSFTGNIPSLFGILVELRFLNLRNNFFTGSIPSFVTNMSKLEVFDISFNPLQGEIPEAFGSLFNLKELRLQSNNLIGVVPMSVFNISTMENLALTGNSLSGNLPEGMCRRLWNLKTLYLSSNELEGPIPLNISECSQLTVLSLWYNKFTGSIPRGIGSLRALEVLYLSFNHFTGEIPKEIGNLEKLTELRMEDNFFVGSVPSSICNSSSLQYINVAECNLTGSIPSDMCSSSSQLRKAYFYGNNLTGSIPKGIGNLTMLQMLYIGYNKLTGTIPEGIGNLNNLLFLDLSYNDLSGYIPEKIFNISTLRSIVVSSNKLLGHLPSILNHGLPDLEVFYLDHNFFFGEMTDSISNSSKLIFLDFSFNNLTGQIPHSFGKLSLLEILLLTANNLVSETSELSFITPLSNCSYLSEFSIGANPFNGVLPVSIGNLSTSIQKLYAHNCGLRGRIPDGLGNLENLIILGMFRNELTGAIPNTLENLRKLQAFSLHHNKLRGSIPDILCTLPNLALLSLMHNKITGSIPDCIGNLTSLRALYLGTNRLNYVIPTSLWRLRDILELDLSSNMLTGSLPSDIRYMKVATILDFSKNQFSSIIPSSIGGVGSIVDLSLARNRFQGSIPESIGKLVSLETLDLSHNNLSGTISTSLEALQYLKYFDVSFNELSGPIPTGGPFKSFPSKFFISNEGLCGDSKYGVPPCHENTIPKSKRKKVSPHVVYVFVGISMLAFIIAMSYLLARYREKNKVESPTESSFITAPSRVSYQELVKATEGFNENHLLGTGSYGSVYKGTLEDGEDVAVKVFHSHSEGGFKSFDTECEVLRTLRHRNLCKVIGSCSNEDFKALVLKYMPNGSLEQWLYLENNFLNIVQRLNIMIDIACALEYLHYGYSIPIIHCDLKPSNVLLDEEMVAHLSDFGVAKLLSDGVSVTLTRTLATLGYIAPEYGSEGLVSVKCDVYSYGIMLMEVFTGMKPNDIKFTGDLSLRKWVNDCVPDAIVQVIDSELLNSEEEYLHEKVECLVSIMEIALKCCMENPSERRISMKYVVVALKKIMSQHLQYYTPKQVSNL
ncbi:uncharacterized protein [Henckelia pumila]|uniref:uncharacterized protein n=1 Tax=Henckelia pumila TaxID=405737 RepID=UPI003C6E7724